MRAISRASVTVLTIASLSAGQQVTSITATATYNNIGLEVVLNAAPPSGAGIALQWNPSVSSQPFHDGHPLSQVASTRFAGSVFGLDDGAVYVVRLRGNGFALDTAVYVTTRADTIVQPGGTAYHVAKGGSDGNLGTSLGQAFATLAHALSVAQAGATILLHAGHYYESVSTSRSGNADAPILIRNAPGEVAVLDGRDTTFRPTWSAYNAGAGVYRTACTVQPQLAYHNGGHLFASPSLADLVSNTWSMPSGFFADGSYLYVRVPGGGAPGAADTIQIPAATTGITGTGVQYLQVRGLEICYYGRDEYSRGIYLDGAAYCLVDSCYLHHSAIGVALKRACRFNTVQRCRFTESPIDTWNWAAVKEGTGYYEAGGVVVYGSPSANTGNVIRRNVFSHVFDGSHLYSEDAAGPTSNMDYHDNVIEYANDDCIETDGAGTNCRIYSNTFSTFLTGVSVAPAQGGPTYIMRNTFAGWDTHSGYVGYPVKFNVSSSLTIDWVYLYHNTCWTSASGQPGFLFKQYSNWRNVISRNNIYAGTDYALQSSSSQNPVDFDYDDLYTTASGRLVDWSGARYTTVAAFSAATTQELHGRSVVPGFTDASGGIFTLAAGSHLIDSGVVMAGINDGYAGNAPDIGRYESGAAPVRARAPGVRQVLSLRALVEPGSGRVTFRLAGAPARGAVVRVYSANGAMVFVSPVTAGQAAVTWDSARRAPGCYTVEAAWGGQVSRQALVLMR